MYSCVVYAVSDIVRVGEVLDGQIRELYQKEMSDIEKLKAGTLEVDPETLAKELESVVFVFD